MIYNYTTCESVIAKIMADLDISEKNQRITDIREWIFEAVDKIGAPMQYVQKESGADGVPIIKMEDYQVPMPSDLAILNGVAFSLNENGPYIPLRTNTGTFKEPKHDTKKQCNIPQHDPNNKVLANECETEPMQEEHQPMQYKLPTSQSQFYTVNGVKYIERFMLNGGLKQPSYFIKPGWIVTNQQQGFIKLAYKSIATDGRGYPLIPDLSSYQEAIYWYVTMKLSFPKFMDGTLGGRSRNSTGVYSYIQQSWNFYRKQAYAEAMMPTEDNMRSIKNEWNKILPEFDSDDTFFEHIGDKQSIYNDYYYGY